MRDRLIELIEDVLDTLCEVGNGITDDELHKSADKLFEVRKIIENGVIVPTLNCGDRVWFIPKGLGEVCEATVVRIEYNYFTSPQEWIVLDYISSIVGKHEYKSRVDLMLGKTVFLTKEEAEQALKEGGQ